MSARIIDGLKIAERIKHETKTELKGLSEKIGKIPKLASIIIGENPATKVYVKNQSKIFEELEIPCETIELKDDISENHLEEKITLLNSNKEVAGIMLNLPLPAQINQRKFQNLVSPIKDVEGMTAENIGKLFYAEFNPTVAPCTALSVIECLKETAVPLKGKETVIVGHSEIVGKPALLMLLSSLSSSVTPTVCHIATVDLSSHTKNADILIVAVGKDGLIRSEFVKVGAIVIDVGINRIPMLDEAGNQVIDIASGKKKTKIVGDVLFDEVAQKASFITPVPGGVGSVTTVLLAKNLVNLIKLQNNISFKGYKVY